MTATGTSTSAYGSDRERRRKFESIAGKNIAFWLISSRREKEDTYSTWCISTQANDLLIVGRSDV